MERHGMERHANTTVSACQVVQGSWTETNWSGTTDPVRFQGKDPFVRTALDLKNRRTCSKFGGTSQSGRPLKIILPLYGLLLLWRQYLLPNPFRTTATPEQSFLSLGSSGLTYRLHNQRLQLARVVTGSLIKYKTMANWNKLTQLSFSFYTIQHRQIHTPLSRLHVTIFQTGDFQTPV